MHALRCNEGARAVPCGAVPCRLQASMPRFLSEPVRGTHGWRAGGGGSANVGVGGGPGLPEDELMMVHPQAMQCWLAPAHGPARCAALGTLEGQGGLGPPATRGFLLGWLAYRLAFPSCCCGCQRRWKSAQP